jgi:hypothetical protein
MTSLPIVTRPSNRPSYTTKWYWFVHRYIYLVATTALLMAASALAEEPLTVAFDGQTVRVAGGRGSIAVVLVSRQQRERDVVIHHTVERVIATGRLGEAEIKLPYSVTPFTLAVAIDTTDGRYAVKGAGFRPSALTTDALTRDGAGRLTHASFRAQAAQVVLVRPGHSVWAGMVGEGTSSDDDARPDHRLLVTPERLRTTERTPGPPHMLPRDTLVVIDVESMAVAVVQEPAR